jgi:flagellar biogenesis protein FliO
MLDGNRLIITPLEGGGYEVREHEIPVTGNDIAQAVGSIVVSLAIVGMVCWMVDRMFSVEPKRSRVSE